MSIPCKAHPRAMRRHTQHVAPAELSTILNLEANSLHLLVTHADGGTMRIVLDIHAIKLLHRELTIARAGIMVPGVLL